MSYGYIIINKFSGLQTEETIAIMTQINRVHLRDHGDYPKLKE